jgi:hypothetical protein
MKKTIVTIQAKKLAQVYSKLKKLESKHATLKIGKMPLSHFLIAHSEFENDLPESKELKTNRIILYIAGQFNTDPASLKPATRLKQNLGYQADEYSLLQIKLDKLVKQYKPTARISSGEANNCDTVGDCQDLVVKKT